MMRKEIHNRLFVLCNIIHPPFHPRSRDGIPHTSILHTGEEISCIMSFSLSTTLLLTIGTSASLGSSKQFTNRPNTGSYQLPPQKQDPSP
ncbi:hypothetical protein MtrunA17_Chr6g0464981 [Medicago truncatula]|uniref:Uncharacterized protein n=1 Tax=Medicago truncatula TaxID=3880 RepID=A0A072UA45_MEDTR|nr:hypothetical protein MTR_6g038410 [Medicago truncatula]RHN51122.1 hypothetical protein MtrunA17_Chr6g0464981 [Medicago truncatula]